jgi:hypothetical protein
MALPDLTGQNIQDTYQRVLQVSGSGLIVDGTGSLFTPLNATSASYADFAVSASHEIILEVSSSHAVQADSASYVAQSITNATNITSNTTNITSLTNVTASYATTGSNSFNGTQRTLFTTASIVYSGSNVTQVTQSFGSTQQITNIIYSGSFADGNPLSIAVTGSDGINKLYTLTYSASLVTQIIQI